MDIKLRNEIGRRWNEYFPGVELPIGVFYANELCGAEYPLKPKENNRGYTCIYAQLARLHQGKSLAFDKDNLGCFGSIQNY